MTAGLAPGDLGYDAARAVWNRLHDRRPALIAQCASPADVAAAIAYAREHGLEIAVRGGGHSLPGHSTVEGGLVIDLRALNHVVVAGDRVRVGGGALLGDVDRGAQAHGLVVPAGVVSHTGVGGLTLGGGVGRLMRRFGLTIDSLLSAEVVLADGRTVRASEDSQPELFWGLRGGGGNFGVVTEFEFRAHPLRVLPILATFHPLERARDVLRMAAPMADAPDELLWTSFLRRGPADAPWMAPELAGAPGVMCLIEWSGEPAEGRDVLAAIRRELDPPAGSLDDVPYLAIQSITDRLLAPGTLHAYVKAGFTEALGEPLIDALVDRGAHVGSPLSAIEVLAMGGAIRRVPDDATAFPHRSASWLINIPGQWADPADTGAEIAWVALREAARVLVPGGRLGAATFAEPERNEGTALHLAMKALVDEPADDGYTPYALSSAQGLERALRDAGLEIAAAGEVPVTWAYPDAETALRALLASAGGARAVRAVGEERVRAALLTALGPFRNPAGAVALANRFRYVVGVKP